ncbi:hypothetical protein T492DRAFT_291561 [Pavlovales sp. CCMP2436]|nr:hypothetical protein T492DRAFT_291561 [Pavlovales sp. CCMP2436]
MADEHNPAVGGLALSLVTVPDKAPESSSTQRTGKESFRARLGSAAGILRRRVGFTRGTDQSEEEAAPAWRPPDWSEEAAPAVEAAQERSVCFARARRYILPLLFVSILLGVVIFTAINTRLVLKWLVSVLQFLRRLNRNAIPVVIFAEIILVTLGLPSWFLWLGAGAAFTILWGTPLGPAIAMLSIGGGVWVGSVLAFLLGRYALHPMISEWTSGRLMFQAIDLAVEQRGLEIGMLLKLSPVIPLNVVNYLLSVTQMRFWQFVVTCPGSFLAGAIFFFFFMEYECMCPGAFMRAYISLCRLWIMDYGMFVSLVFLIKSY